MRPMQWIIALALANLLPLSAAQAGTCLERMKSSALERMKSSVLDESLRDRWTQELLLAVRTPKSEFPSHLPLPAPSHLSLVSTLASNWDSVSRLTLGFESWFRSLIPNLGPGVVTAKSLKKARHWVKAAGFLSALESRPLISEEAVFVLALLTPIEDDLMDLQDLPFSREVLRPIDLSLVQNKIDPLVHQRVQLYNTLFARFLTLLPPKTHPQLYSTAQYVHEAQLKSRAQFTLRDPEFLLRLAIEKGGTSNAMGAMVLFGTLTQGQVEFYFKMGGILQLLDDVGDVHEDTRAGIGTWVTVPDGSLTNPREKSSRVDRLIHYFSYQSAAYREDFVQNPDFPTTVGLALSILSIRAWAKYTGQKTSQSTASAHSPHGP